MRQSGWRYGIMGHEFLQAAEAKDAQLHLLGLTGKKENAQHVFVAGYGLGIPQRPQLHKAGKERVVTTRSVGP